VPLASVPTQGAPGRPESREPGSHAVWKRWQVNPPSVTTPKGATQEPAVPARAQVCPFPYKPPKKAQLEGSPSNAECGPETSEQTPSGNVQRLSTCESQPAPESGPRAFVSAGGGAPWMAPVDEQAIEANMTKAKNAATRV
jgi:hypothetical protein